MLKAEMILIILIGVPYTNFLPIGEYIQEILGNILQFMTSPDLLVFKLN